MSLQVMSTPINPLEGYFGATRHLTNADLVKMGIDQRQKAAADREAAKKAPVVSPDQVMGLMDPDDVSPHEHALIKVVIRDTYEYATVNTSTGLIVELSNDVIENHESAFYKIARFDPDTLSAAKDDEHKYLEEVGYYDVDDFYHHPHRDDAPKS